MYSMLRIAVAVAMAAVLLALAPIVEGLADEEQSETPKSNPYLARPGSTPEQLAKYLERMQQRPISIRRRPGFTDAVLDAADRILTSTKQEELVETAVLTKLTILHERGVEGDEASDEQVVAIAGKYEKHTSGAIAKAARFYLLEREAIDADAFQPEGLAGLLDRLREFFAEETLEERHLRIASATVAIINRLPNDEDAAKAYKEFGERFATSKHKRLKEYGERIAKGPKRDKQSSLVGKQIELKGTTLLGDELDLKSLRGKVVLIDFWATWCKPCVAALPGIKQVYEQHHAAGFEVVGVSVDKDVEALEKFVAQHELPWPTIVDQLDEMANAKKFGVRKIPTTLLIDKQGAVAAVDLKKPELIERLQKMLAAEAPAEGNAKDLQP